MKYYKKVFTCKKKIPDGSFNSFLYIPVYLLYLHDPVHYTTSIPHFWQQLQIITRAHPGWRCYSSAVCLLFILYACVLEGLLDLGFFFCFFFWVCTEASICRVSPGTGPPKTSCSLARVEKEHSQMAVNVQTHPWLRKTIQSSFLSYSFVMTSQYSSYLFIGFLVIKLWKRENWKGKEWHMVTRKNVFLMRVLNIEQELSFISLNYYLCFLMPCCLFCKQTLKSISRFTFHSSKTQQTSIFFMTCSTS